MEILWQVELKRVAPGGSSYWPSWHYAINNELGCTRTEIVGTSPELMAGDLDSDPDIVVPWGWGVYTTYAEPLSIQMHMEIIQAAANPVAIVLSTHIISDEGAPDYPGLTETFTYEGYPGGSVLRTYDTTQVGPSLANYIHASGGTDILDDLDVGSFQLLTLTCWTDAIEPEYVPAGYFLTPIPNLDGLGDGVDVNFA